MTGVGALVREGTSMLKVVHDADASKANAAGSVGGSLLDAIVRNGARQMLAAALHAEVAAHVVRVNTVKPRFSPGSALGRDASPFLQFISKRVISPLAPMIKYWSTPKAVGLMIATLLATPGTDSGVYYDEKGRPMRGSEQVNDPALQDRVVAESRALLKTHAVDTATR